METHIIHRPVINRVFARGLRA